MSEINNKYKVLAIAPLYNEAGKIGKLAKKFSENEIVSLFMVVDDGSTDDSPAEAKKYGAMVIHQQRTGVGSAIKVGVKYGLQNNFDIIVVLAGNGKDDPAEIPDLLKPIIEEGYDYVQGSRFLLEGSYENTPAIRLFLVRAFTVFWRMLTGFTITDASNGFRAYRLSLFDDKRLNIWQDWLNGYEYEYYLHYLVHKLKYKVKEVPVSKIYPVEKRNYSKIRPIVDWWKMVRPLIFLKLGIKK